MGNIKIIGELELQTRNDSVTPNIKGQKRGIIWVVKKLLIIDDHRVIG